MKKLTFLLMALIVGAFSVQAGPSKAPARSQVYSYLPSGYIALGTYDNPNHIYYSTQQQNAVPMGNVHGISIIGEVDGKYYSTTYAKAASGQSDAGAGFIAAMKVDGLLGGSQICNCQSGTTINSVDFSARVEPAGEYAARIIYTLHNGAWLTSRTVSLGVWADIMIGDNDDAPIYCLRNDQGKVYGLDMKYKKDEDAAPDEKIPVFTALFGQGVTGVTPVDDYWFGQFRNNYNASEIVGDYDNLCDIQHGSGSSATFEYDVEDVFYMTEGGSYDSGMGFCWKDITLAVGETVELSFIVSASEIDIEEPEPDPEEAYNVEVFNTEVWNDLPADHPAHIWGYYKNPFGQTGYIEFMVDGTRGTGEWTRIEGDLISDSEFDLPFVLNFDPDVTDIHTLKLRVNDGLGNYRNLDELDQEWEDVRSIPMTVDPLTHYYDGTPKTFVVNVGGVFDYPFEYTELGTYDFSIYGDYEMNTIGINTIEFSIVKRQPELNVVIPDDCVYDGEEHAATVTYDGDGIVTVTYKNTETGEESENAPVEPGTYEVFVEVSAGECYNGIDKDSYGEFTIDKAPSEIIATVPDNCLYDAQPHAATAELVVGDGDLTITYVNTATGEVSEEAPVEPGTYNVVVTVTETDHYYGLEETVGTFTIGLGGTEIDVDIPEDCIYDGEPHAATATMVVGDGEIVITYRTETGEILTDAPVAVGTYEVFVEVINSVNYNDLPNTSYGSFTIGKAQTIIDVTIPEDCLYDGEAHAATATMIAGDGEIVITYVKKDNREATTEAPVEPGTYEVFVEVINSVNYNDLPNTSYGEFTIGKLQSEIEFEIPEDCDYDGKEHAATVTLVEGDGVLTVYYVDTKTGEVSEDAPIEPGTYAVVVEVTETDHYLGIDRTELGQFTIKTPPTGIDEISSDSVEDGIWYTIDGRRVVAPTERGIYIRNGKKYYRP